MSENRCVCCGDIIPEGRQICPYCEQPEIYIAVAETEKRTITVRGTLRQCAAWCDAIISGIGGAVRINIRREKDEGGDP